MREISKKTQQAVGEHSGVRRLLEAAYADNTRRAYKADIASFLEWGGSIPTTPEEIARFISKRVTTHSVHTIKRQLSALTNLHNSLGCSPNPLQSPLIAQTMRGATHIHGRPQRAIEPLLVEDLRAILDRRPKTTLGARDAALLAIGFAGGFRRSELVALDFEDIQEEKAGLTIMIQRSKTDQSGRGRVIGIPFGRGRYCPVRYLETWGKQIEDQNGPVFRACAKGGNVSENRLSSEAVAKIVKRHVARIGLSPLNYSGHSLRSGFVTSAIRAGATENAIRRQTGHASNATLARYIRLANLFEDNATQLLF